MSKALPWIIVAVVAGFAGWRVASSCADEERQRIERARYERESDSLRARIEVAEQQTTTIIKRIPIERVKVVHDSVLVDSVRALFQRDSTTADSLHTAVQVIGAQDSLITSQRVSIQTLNSLTLSQAATLQLYRIKSATDSLRIAALDKQARGHRFLGLRLPKARCGPGAGISVGVGGKVQPGLILGCVIGY